MQHAKLALFYIHVVVGNAFIGGSHAYDVWANLGYVELTRRLHVLCVCTFKPSIIDECVNIFNLECDTNVNDSIGIIY